MKTLILTTAATLCLCTGAGASTLLLPNPLGSQVIAAWVGTNAQIVPAPTGSNPDATELQWDGPWASMQNLAASYTGVGGSFEFNSSLAFNPMGSTSIYTMNAINSTYSLSASGYSGPAIGKLILQVSVGSNGDRHLGMNPSLEIGGTTFTAAQASFGVQNNYGGTQSESSTLNDPNSQYNGNWGLLALVTYEWDLSALGYLGVFDDFAVNWTFPQSHTAMYEAQLSVVSAVPEPADIALLAGGAAAFAAVLYRRRRAKQ